MNSDPNRRQDGVSWSSKAIVFSLAATIAGSVFGGLLGLLGSHIPDRDRVAVASLLAVAGMLLGLLDFGSWQFQVLQRDRETSQTWMKYGALRWAAANGAALGVGATSRIGFWLWYAIPESTFLFGNPLLGSLVYGLYSFARGGSIWLVLFGRLNHISGGDPSSWLLAQAGGARLVASAQLVILATATAIVVGL